MLQSNDGGNRHLKGMAMFVTDSNLHISESHIADELGYIVKGILELNLEGVIYTLHQGDSTYIPANTKHSFKKLSEEDSISIWTLNNTSLKD